MSMTKAGSEQNSNIGAGAGDRDSQPRASDAPIKDSRWAPILSSGLTIIGVACAAAYTSAKVADKGVGIAAWVAVAVVGSAAAISTARNNH